MTTIYATGHHPGDAPTLTISHGKGNVDGLDEVHVMIRDIGDHSTRTILGWFPREQVLAALASKPEPSACACGRVDCGVEDARGAV